MTIINKLLGNPIVICVLLVAILFVLTLPTIIQLDKAYKWLYFLCIMLAYSLTVPVIFTLYETNRGSGHKTEFRDVFPMSDSTFNIF